MKRYSKPIHLPKPVTGPKHDSSLALINVVFLLLVFLLVSGTLRPPLPDDFEWAETTAETGAESLHGSLVLDQDGQIWQSGRSLSNQDLEQILSGLADKDNRLTLQVDKRAQIASVAAIAERLKASGFTQLTLITVEAGPP